MSQKNDQIFQLSLTEIAFTVAFILLLLLGYLVFKEQTERKALEDQVSAMGKMDEAADKISAVEKRLKTELAAQGSANPEEVITRLIEAEELRIERNELLRRIADLDAKLTALTELKAELEKAASAAGGDVTQTMLESALTLRTQVLKAIDEVSRDEQFHAQSDKEVEVSMHSRDAAADESPVTDEDVREFVTSAIAAASELRRQLHEQMNVTLEAGNEAETVKGIVLAAKKFTDLAAAGISTEQVQKENADLRGQVAFLKNRLEARGGRDYPPCWANEHTGKVEFLFSVDMQPGSLEIRSAWPKEREMDAAALPGVMEMIADSPIENSDFTTRVKGVFDISQKMQCRHYVLLKSLINDAVESDRARLMVENYFYKVEVRR